MGAGSQHRTSKEGGEAASGPPRTSAHLGRAGLCYGLLFGTAWSTCEGLYHWYFGVDPLTWNNDPSMWPVLRLTAGVLAPFVVLVGVGCAVAAFGWATPGLGDALVDRLRSAWTTADPDRRAGQSAGLVTAVTVGLAVLAVTLVLGPTIMAAIQTPTYAFLALLAAQAVALALAVTFAPLVLLPVLGMVRRMVRHRALALLVHPGALATIALVAAVVAALGFLAARPGASLLPWELAACPSMAALGTAWLAIRLGKLAPRRRAVAQWIAVGLLLLPQLWVGATTAAIPTRERRELNDVVSLGGLTGLWFAAWSRALDFDGDGAGSLYGGSDCAPFDGNVHPRRVEVPGNGIDEDCSGRDLVGTGLTVERGPLRYPRPAAMSATPNIILVTTDALGYDHTGVGGYGRDVTPFLDAWAERATVFETAFSVGPATDMAFPTLMTGAYPSDIPLAAGAATRPPPLAEDLPTLARMLSNAGYDTVAVPGYIVLANWPGFIDGFQRVETAPYTEAARHARKGKVHSGPLVTAQAIREVRAQRQRPLFLWVHYFDHHSVYVVPEGEEPFGQGTDELDVYDTELRFADRLWGELFAAIEERWAPGDVLVIFTADHGEAFDANHAHGGRHDQSLHTREVQVPLIVQGPAQRGTRIGGLASHLDLVPTIANLVPLCASLPWRGESLVGALFEGKPPGRTGLFAFYYAAVEARRGNDPLQQISLRTNTLYYYRDFVRDAGWVARWREDPLELHDLTDELPDEADALRYLANRTVLELGVGSAPH